VPLTSQEESQLSANRLGEAINVYAVGLDTGVVSFFSQQCRAFDLARLFAKKQVIESFDNHKIGIIGGGVAGTTLWAALQAYGFKDVTLYEASDEILARQASASHRHAHPAINDWPLFDAKRQFSSTTKWPFLNWFGTDAASVVRQMRDDPYIKALRAAAPERVKLRHIAVSISEDNESGATDLPPVAVSFQTHGENVPAYFDTLFFAVGYDYEVNLDQSASNSYWWPDNVREYLWDRHEYVEHKFLMSGTGDGGLIDLIRLAEKPNLAGKRSNVSMEVVGHLRHESYQTLDNTWESEPSDREKKMAGAIKSKTLDQPKTQRIFHELFKSDSFKNYFVDDADLKRITLLANTGNFLQGGASPVNKVLVSHLAARFPSLVKKGLIKENGRPSHIKADGTAGEPLHTDEDFKKVVVFMRHGAKSRADRIEGVAKMRGTTPHTGAATGDAVNYDIADVFDNLRISHGRSARDVEWAHIETLVAQYLDTFFDDASFTFSGNKDAVRIDVHAPLTEENKRAYKRLGGFDKELFGIDVVYNVAEGLDLTTDTMESRGV
jgi:hypothetical protein